MQDSQGFLRGLPLSINNFFSSDNLTELIFGSMEGESIPSLYKNYKYYLVKDQNKIYLVQSNQYIAKLFNANGIYGIDNQGIKYLITNADEYDNDKDVRVLRIEFSFNDYESNILTVYVSGILYCHPD